MVPLITVSVFVAIFLFVLGLATRESLAIQRLQAALEGTLPRHLQLEEPFLRRTLLPGFLRLARAVERRTPAATVEETRRLLTMAGLWRLDPIVFLTLRLLAAGGLVLLALVTGLPARLPPHLFTLASVLAGLVGYVAPSTWLRSRIARRQEQIARRLPDALDLLTICVEAGLGLDQALDRVGRRMGGPLGEEILRYLDEVRLGKERTEALRDMATRTGVTDLQSFVTTLVQAIHLGVSIGEVLRVQASYARTIRRQRIEERAMKAPAKVLFPIILFIFPALFVAVAGPAAIHLARLFGSLR